MSQSKGNTEILVALPKVVRTADGLRDALFDEIDLLRAGEVSTVHARALANLIRQLLDFARLELQHKQALKHSSKQLKGDNAPTS